jgi:outer membrane protein
MKRSLLVLLGLVSCGWAASPAPKPIPANTLEKSPPTVLQIDLVQAEAIALHQSPTVSEAQFKSLAANQVVREVRSAFFPQITAEFTGVVTDHSSVQRLGATGGLANPTILDRESNGVLLSQLITDFGRTWNLTAAQKNLALSEAQRSALARARALLLVDQCYFQVQQAQALLRVADETIMERQLLADQIEALARSQLKSELDGSFARVNLDQARLIRLEASNRVEAAFAELSNALGYREHHRFALLPVPQFEGPKGNLAECINQALSQRPEALALRNERDAALQLVAANHAAHLPKVSLIGAAGRTPYGETSSTPVEGNYAMAGVIVEVPIFTGYNLSARDQESALRAKASAQSLREVEDLIAKDVEVALLNTTTATDKLSVTANLLANAQQAYDLADSKYKIGITSIVELSQAQLAKLQAQIDHTTAAYEYQIDRLILEFQIGSPKYLQPQVR